MPSPGDILRLMHKAADVIPPVQLWVDPDCGLKARAALANMVEAARLLRGATA